jgi:hypothetical protein
MTLAIMSRHHPITATRATLRDATDGKVPPSGLLDVARPARRLRRARFAAVTGIATAIMVIVSPLSSTVAHAGPAAPPRDGQAATFAGHVINMKNGWDGAQTCVVQSRSRVQCYATAEAADQTLGYSVSSDPLVRQTAGNARAARAVPSCASGYVCLWAAINGGGRRLIFRDDYWQDLRSYGFHNEISSWRNHQSQGDYAWLKDIHGGGPGPDEYLVTSGGQYVANVGAYWNDRADYVEG